MAEKHVQLKVKANGTHASEDPFGRHGNDDVKEIAKRFEEKYGTGAGMRRKKHKDVAELGVGYDETDPFIDNSDVYDEDLPANKRPARGGFYINVRRLSSDADDDVTTGDDQEPGGKRPRKRLGRPPKKDGTLLQKKKRRAIDGLLKKKTSLTVKEMIEQKKAQNRLQRSSPSPPPDSPIAPANGHDSMDETIATVVAAALSAELAELVAAIKAAAVESNGGKQKFFTPEVNKMLLNIELRSQQELLRNDRQAVYLHLAARLPCGAQTLTKRAKQLVLNEEKHVIRRPLNRLKEAIDATMPTLQERYAEECKKIMEAKDLPMPDSKKAEQPAKDDAKPPRLPRKRFRWSEATSTRLRRVVEVRAHSFKMLKKRQGSAEEFLKTFLQTDVLPLWENGWMTAKELMKHALPVFQEEIK
ncbi:ubinuclein-2-like [Pollicipes pollicipes]|uniref:ubinuclein-2-like n=1 Tax=Pollicipes pollicipes TaxID=41117 RepID=UPI001885650F|nr:ubinuclein-2-like [Pollicipes pollicipes]